MGAIYDAESLAENATEGFQAGLGAPAPQTSWLFASSSLFTNKRDREREWSPITVQGQKEIFWPQYMKTFS